MLKKIKLSDIKIEFDGSKSPPKDNILIFLLKKAYQGKILCHTTIIEFDGIKPFSNYKPQISKEFREYFIKSLRKENYLPLYVYQDGDKFIMSDDYNSYYLYKELGYNQVLALVLGDPDGKYVISKGKPFKLPPPTVKVINE